MVPSRAALYVFISGSMFLGVNLLSGIPQEAASLALSSGIVFCLVGLRFYSGLLWGGNCF